ncbi:MAG: oligosaccharide flippase family protein [candidate division WOR-3 bacterium]
MNIKIATNSLILTITRFINLVVMIIYLMILTRFLTLKEYGTFSQILLISNFATIVLGFGLASSVNYFMAKEDNVEGRSNFLSIFYTFSIFISVIIGVTLILTDSFFAKYFNNNDLISYSIVFFILPFAIISKSSFDNILIVSNKTKNLLFFKIFHSALLLITVSLNIIFKSNFKTFLTFYLAIELIVSIIFLLYIYFYVNKFKFKIENRILKSILKFSIPLGLATTISTINIELDKFIIGRFFDTEKLAIYTNGSKEMPVTIISGSLISILMPIIVREIKRKNYKMVFELWNKTNELSLMFISYFIVIFLVFAPEIVTLLYSKKYIESVPIFRIYSLLLFLKFTYFGMLLNASGKTKFIFYSSLISLILNLFLNILFIKLIGFIGPAIATLLSLSVVAFFQLIYTSKMIGYSFFKIFKWNTIVKIILVTFLFSIILEILKIFILKFKINSYLSFIVLSFLFSIFYFIFVFRKKILHLWKYLNNYKLEDEFKNESFS